MENQNNENYENGNQNSPESKDYQNPQRRNEDERSDLSRQATDRNENTDDFHANDDLKQDGNSERKDFKDTDPNRYASVSNTDTNNNSDYRDESERDNLHLVNDDDSDDYTNEDVEDTEGDDYDDENSSDRNHPESENNS